MLFIVLKVAVGEYSNLLISLEVSLFLDFFSQRFLIFSSFEKNPVNKHSKTKLWWSVSNQSNFISLAVSILLSYMFNLNDRQPRVLLRIITWNLSLLAIIWLLWNQSIVLSAFFPKFCRRSFKLLTGMTFPSAILCKSEFVRYSNRSFRNMLNTIAPNINLWVTLDKNILNYSCF